MLIDEIISREHRSHVFNILQKHSGNIDIESLRYRFPQMDNDFCEVNLHTRKITLKDYMIEELAYCQEGFQKEWDECLSEIAGLSRIINMTTQCKINPEESIQDLIKYNTDELCREYTCILVYEFLANEFINKSIRNKILLHNIENTLLIKKELFKNETIETKQDLMNERRKQFGEKRPMIYLALIQRDGHKCRICSTKQNISIDHKIPLSKGGSDELENLQLLCRSCNSRKGDR